MCLRGEQRWCFVAEADRLLQLEHLVGYWRDMYFQNTLSFIFITENYVAPLFLIYFDIFFVISIIQQYAYAIKHLEP